LALAITLSLSPSLAVATAPPTDGPTAAELFRDGQARADAADYEGAIEKFEQAFSLLPDVEGNEGTRNRLRVELVRARRKAFKIDDDPTHLTKAKVLLEDYVHSLGEGQSENREWAEWELLQIEGAIKDYEAKRAQEPQAEETEPEDEPSLEISPAPGPQSVDGPPPDPNAGRSLLVAGGVLGGLGIGSAIMMAAGLGKANKAVDTFKSDPAQRDNARADNQLGNTLGIAGGVAAGVFLTAGAVLMVLGAKRRKGNGRTAVAPTFDGKQVGAILRARF
jgi:hypothetical protein